MVAPAGHAAPPAVVFVVNAPPPPQPGLWMHDSTGLVDPERVSVGCWLHAGPHAAPAAVSANAGAEAAARRITAATNSTAARRTKRTRPFSVNRLSVHWEPSSAQRTPASGCGHQL